MSMQFTKMHGLGNDFIVLDGTEVAINLEPGQVRLLADRRLGIGCDQLLLVECSPDANAYIRIFNADGTTAEQCGNGLRCVARWLVQQGLTGSKSVRLATSAGHFEARLVGGDQVQVNMGVPSFEPADIPFDANARAVHVTLDNGVTRTARIFGSQGAVTLPLGSDDVFFTPSIVTPDLPPPADLPWPMGDVVEADDSALDLGKIEHAVDLAFAGDAMTAAFVVTHHGNIVAERYREGIGIHTPLESWSMGKSMTATLLGRLIHQGAYDLWQPAPIPEWQLGDDPRAQIRIADIMRMSSGLRFRAMQDPDYDPALGYPDHLYVYTGGINAFEYAATRSQQWPPNTVGRYRNGDPVLANYLIRLAVEGRGDNYHAFPQRALFDKLGMRDTTIETDPYGNFLLQGYEFDSARDWARLAYLYLNDGVSNGERLLPEGWTDFVSTLAPGWAADDRPIYGAFFWLNGDGALPIPRAAYMMS